MTLAYILKIVRRLCMNLLPETWKYMLNVLVGWNFYEDSNGLKWRTNDPVSLFLVTSTILIKFMDKSSPWCKERSGTLTFCNLLFTWEVRFVWLRQFKFAINLTETLTWQAIANSHASSKDKEDYRVHIRGREERGEWLIN